MSQLADITEQHCSGRRLFWRAVGAREVGRSSLIHHLLAGSAWSVIYRPEQNFSNTDLQRSDGHHLILIYRWENTLMHSTITMQEGLSIPFLSNCNAAIPIPELKHVYSHSHSHRIIKRKMGIIPDAEVTSAFVTGNAWRQQKTHIYGKTDWLHFPYSLLFCYLFSGPITRKTTKNCQTFHSFVYLSTKVCINVGPRKRKIPDRKSARAYFFISGIRPKLDWK